MRHKNAAIIIAWINGATIEVQSPTTDQWTIVPMAAKLGQDNVYLDPSPIHPEYDYMRFRIAEKPVMTDSEKVEQLVELIGEADALMQTLDINSMECYKLHCRFDVLACDIAELELKGE